jgi:hypothetical protein
MDVDPWELLVKTENDIENAMENNMVLPHKLNLELQFDPIISLLGVLTK